jgi:hypothetical protein
LAPTRETSEKREARSYQVDDVNGEQPGLIQPDSLGNRVAAVEPGRTDTKK